MNQPKASMYREEALKHYLRSEDGRCLIRVSPPWTWSLLTVFGGAVLVALIASFFGRVEVNGRGRGIVRPTTGIRMLLSQTAGTVGKIDVRSSQLVAAGDSILSIEAPNLQGQFLESDRQFASVQGDYQKLVSQQDAAYSEQSKKLQERIHQLKDQIKSYQNSESIYQRRLNAQLTLRKEGLVSELEVDVARDGLEQARRQLGNAHQLLDQTQQEQAAMESRRQDELWQRKQVFQGVETKRDALGFLKNQMVIQAPEEGLVEALLVRPGDVVQPGQPVGKLIPKNAPLHVVSFLAEKDRAFVKNGDLVHLELDQLPYSEYGTLQAKVIRVSDDLASPYEVKEALGDDQRFDVPTYRVELEITDKKAIEKAKVNLKSGMLMNVRFTLRRQRLITMVIDPLKKWFK